MSQDITKKSEAPAVSEKRVVYRKPNYAIHTTDNGYRVEVDLPGVSKDQARITLDGDYLVVEAQRDDYSQASWQALRREIPSGIYKLNLELNDAIDTESIEASTRDGVLTLTLPKAAKAAKRSIAIE